MEKTLLGMGVSQEAADALASENPEVTIRLEPSRGGWSMAMDGRPDLGEAVIVVSPAGTGARLMAARNALAKRWCEAWEKSR